MKIHKRTSAAPEPLYHYRRCLPSPKEAWYPLQSQRGMNVTKVRNRLGMILFFIEKLHDVK